MVLSRPTKRLLAGIAAAFLLLCQTAMAAQACGLTSANAGEHAASEPCHESIFGSGEAPRHTQEQGCPSEYASASFAKLDIPQAADLPALLVQPDRVHTPLLANLNAAAPPARAESPPLTILHCCLRN